ncbi:zeta toxin family protein [Pseudomonas sp. C2B4]|uniref:zeta toxin family protein n=1 Tax=Pseudomonas sp. C2B4 TaxID=2735270 RepID=UPI00158660B2|nr:zeta toxin family protein [Pseudomonas sp. C2B4]NUU38040.1 Zeta toxin [Pseudomonas sp. C2B4]
MSQAPKYTYTDDQVTAAFNEISATLFSGITVEAVPKILFVAGLEASGKTYLLEKQLLPSKRYANYIRLYLPEYRKKHPQYDEMIKRGVLHAYEHTESFVREVCARIFKQAFSGQYNIIMETAFDSIDLVCFTPSATASGYQFEIHIVGCTQEFAHLSSFKRALKSLQDNEMERFLSVSKLDAGMSHAKAIIVALQTAVKAISGSQINLYERGFGTLKERTHVAQSTYSKAADGTVSTTTTKVNFSYDVYSSIIENQVFAVSDRNELLKECNLALLQAAIHAPKVPDFVYNELYAYIVKYVNR